MMDRQLLESNQWVIEWEQLQSEYRRTQQMLQKLRGGLEILHEVAFHVDLCEFAGAVHQLVVDAAEQLVGSSECRWYVLEEDRLVVKATSPQRAVGLGIAGDLGEALAVRTYLSGKSSIHGSDEGFAPLPSSTSSPRSGISLPIDNSSVLCVFSPCACAFTKDDEQLLRLLIRYAASTLKRIELRSGSEQNAP